MALVRPKTEKNEDCTLFLESNTFNGNFFCEIWKSLLNEVLKPLFVFFVVHSIVKIRDTGFFLHLVWKFSRDPEGVRNLFFMSKVYLLELYQDPKRNFEKDQFLSCRNFI